MCFGGGAVKPAGPQYQLVSFLNPGTGQQDQQYAEVGVPAEYVARGINTVAGYQQAAAQDTSDKQIQAQQQIATQQQAFNQQQADTQQQEFQQQQDQANAQAQRQSEYDTGRAQALGDASNQVNTAFAKFSPDYFQQYAKDYVSKAQDQIDYQKAQAEKNLAFGVARQGISDSQATVNQQGILDETAGRATADQTANAQQAAAQLQQNTAQARANILGQVANAQSIGSPIAGSTTEDVNAALNTQRSAISGIANTAGDTAASLQAVPVVNTLGNLFASAITSGGNALGGFNAGNVSQQVKAGLAGTSPGGTSTTG
jgi:hypothetical protein